MPDDSIRLTHDLRIPVDGETAAATRYEPTDADGPLPAVLMLIPYRKDDYITYGAYDPLLRAVARAGYEVVAADLLGTGGSSGVKTHPLDAGEGEEAVAIIEWLADREWTDGTVGMVGKSYGGWTQLLAAERDPEPLKAIVPVMAPFSAYDDSRYPTGAMSLKHAGGWLPQMQTFAALPPSYRDSEGRWADVWRERLDGLADGEPWLFDQLRNERRTDYWREHAVDASDISVPMLSVGGWRDYFPGTTLSHLREVDAPVRVLMGPWRHTMPHRGREAAVECRDRIVEWFDQFLKGADAGALDRPVLTHWTEREGGGVVGGGVWRTRDSLPPVASATADPGDGVQSFALSPDGLVPVGAFDAGEVAAEYEYDATVGTESLHYLAPPQDTNPDDVRSLRFATDPLDDAVELTGTGAADVRVTPTTEDLLLSVRVLDLSPDGSASLVTYGTLRASHRDSDADPEPLDPGEETTLSVPLRPASHVFEPGHRLAVAVGTSFFPRLLTPAEHGSLTLRSAPASPSLLSFPGTVHDGDATFADETTLPDPDPSLAPVSSPFVVDSDGSFETTREHRGDGATVRTVGDTTVDLPHGPTMTYEETVEWDAVADEPAATHVASDIVAELDYGTDVVRVETTARTGHDGAALSQSVTRDGEVVFERTWRL